MTNRLEMNRRQFVITTAAIGGGMAVGFGPRGPAKALAADGDVAFGPFFMISADESVTILAPQIDIGFGGQMMQAPFICEELGCDWSKVKMGYAPPTDATRAFKVDTKRPLPNRQLLQTAGATAREQLIAAAATELNVPAASLTAKDGVVTHEATGRKLTYGKLAAKAAGIKLEKEPAIRTPNQYVMLGKPQPKDFVAQLRDKVTGKALYAVDVKLPNMLVATVKASPVFGGKVKSFNATEALKRPGVHAVIEMGKVLKHNAARRTSMLRSGVAVLADSFWQAKSALDVVQIEWDEGDGAKISTDGYIAQARAAVAKSGSVGGAKLGDIAPAFASASKVVEGVYETPFLDHAVMEPMSAVASYTPDRLDVWVGTQQPDTAVDVASQESGLPAPKIFMHEIISGGSFGRRQPNEETRQAVFLSMETKRPVKLIWTREETMRQGIYRPFGIAKLRAAIGPDGFPTALHSHYAGHSGTIAAGNPLPGGYDAGQTRLISDTIYAIPNQQHEFTAVQTNVPTGALRGPATNQNGFMMESFIDEVAFAGGKDPVDLRRHLLREAKDPGWLKVLNNVADKSGYGKTTFPKGTAMGVGAGIDHSSIVSAFSTVTVSQSGQVKVDKVDLSFDLGTVMNPNGVEQQMMGTVIYGINHTLNEEITIRNGRVVEGNFDDYPMVRIEDAPVVVSHFGGLTGGTKFTGAGETAICVIQASICNAVFKITGKRIRSLPLRNHDLSWS